MFGVDKIARVTHRCVNATRTVFYSVLFFFSPRVLVLEIPSRYFLRLMLYLFQNEIEFRPAACQPNDYSTSQVAYVDRLDCETA